RGGFNMAFLGGAVQTTTAGSTFSLPLVARFFSSSGEPVGPGGVLSIASPVTGAALAPSTTFGLVDAQGWATVTLTAGSSVGSYPITITAVGVATTTVGRLTNLIPPIPPLNCSAVVTSTADSGPGSLRSAVACQPAGSTITFAPATFSVPRTITLTAQIPVTRSLIISGPGSSLLTISGNNVTRTLFIDAGAANDVRLFGLTLARGRVSGNGGAVLVQTARSLTISNTKIADSTAMTITGQSNSGNGGGLYISATLPLSLVDSQVTSNTASTAGGLFLGGGATIANSTIASNTAGVGAGVVASATIVISNSTIAANAALNRAGGISLAVGSAAQFIHVSVVANSAPTAAGIAFDSAGSHFFTNTIVGGAAAGQCAGTATKQNFSSISSDAACGLRTVPSVGVGVLGDYGGGQPTAPLVAASPALDAADPAACPALDQRGLSRVGTCDVGAYESRGGFAMTVQGGTVQASTANMTFPAPLVARFTSSNGEPLGPGGVLYVAAPTAGPSLSPSRTTGLVDAQGWATVSLTAGNAIGSYPITITAAGIAAPAFGRLNNCSSTIATNIVTNTDDYGVGSLRDVVACAAAGST
ncbi:MAG: hypothetical protein KGS47_17200, partial [Chloroflexi bacterium]|nr:hypothetical protein [Chloroflexota bacterium]